MTRATLDADDVQTIVQRPDLFFTSQHLQNATFRTKRSGEPMTWAGARAWVFCATTTDGQTIAVRLPKTIHDGAGVRYEALSRHLSTRSRVPLVTTSWTHDGASLPDGEAHPVITMEWVNGKQLDRFVDEILAGPDPKSRLEGLATKWLNCAHELFAAELGHGDIHAGNILIDSEGSEPRITLVDYDCIWVPGLHVGSNESGLGAFQHPGGAVWGRTMDAFPSTVVFLSLRALATEPDLWARSGGRSNDKLLFEQRDFLRPDDSEMLKRLLRSPDTVVQDLTGLLISWIKEGPDAYDTLSEIVGSKAHRFERKRDGPSAGRPLNAWPPRTGSQDSSPGEPGRQTWPSAPSGQSGDRPDSQAMNQPPPPAPPPPPQGPQTWQPGGKPSSYPPQGPSLPPGPPASRRPMPERRFVPAVALWVRAHPWGMVVLVVLLLIILAVL